jgi:hypothetical protein
MYFGKRAVSTIAEHVNMNTYDPEILLLDTNPAELHIMYSWYTGTNCHVLKLESANFLISLYGF